MTFGEALKEARLYRELELKQLALELGRPASYRNYISQIERGILTPGLQVIPLYAGGLDVIFACRGDGWSWRPAK